MYRVEQSLTYSGPLHSDRSPCQQSWCEAEQTAVCACRCGSLLRLMPAQIDGAKVFVTGSTGLLGVACSASCSFACTCHLYSSCGGAGTAVVSQLLAAGYQVQGLVRSDEAAKELAAKGATSFLGDVSLPKRPWRLHHIQPS